MSREPTGFEQEGNDDYDAVVLVCPRDKCGSNNISVSGDQATCDFCGYRGALEVFIPEVMDEESYHGY